MAQQSNIEIIGGVEGMHNLPVRAGLHRIDVLGPLAGDALVGDARAVTDRDRLDRRGLCRIGELDRPPWASQSRRDIFK